MKSINLNLGWIGSLLFIIIVVLACTYNSAIGLSTDYLIAVLVTSLKWFVGIVVIEIIAALGIVVFLSKKN